MSKKSRVSCSADNPSQTIMLLESDDVCLHVAGRVVWYRAKNKNERRVIRRLVHKLNELAAEYIGEPCQRCGEGDCK